MKFKKIYKGLAFFGMFMFFFNAMASQTEEIIMAGTMTRNGNLMTVNIDFGFPDYKVKSAQAVTLTPMIVNGADTLSLPSIGIYGRTRWFQEDRAGRLPLTGRDELALHYKKNLEPIAYNQNVAYQEWMNGSTLEVKMMDYGCATCQTGPYISPDLAFYKEVEYVPVFRFGEAVAEEIKARELSGRAYVDFPVNQTVIYPDYRNNKFELGKILATIDSVKNDKDITVTALHIAGTASPEGPYENNVRLAKGRTEALTEYVRNLYNFPKDFISTSYEPVDWAGLREWLENNQIENGAAILAIVNGDLEPYARNSKIKTTYPVQYKWLLANVYPSLRHSDYRIEYNIRQFTEVAEIMEVMRTAPQKLSLNELYTLAGTLEPGSDVYNEVFETAVRMYPDDETANLNAANSAMQRNDFVTAEKYLAKAGNGANAVYARGVLQALKGNYEEALKLTRQAKAMGLQDADGIIENLTEMVSYK